MRKMSKMKKLVIAAICAAMCYVLPIAFHGLGAGSILSPMHIPVLLCGLVCGGGYGILCGLVGPVLSSLLSSMPPALMLPRMIPELCAYGLAAGVGMRYVKTGRAVADVYISLAAAMVLGRVIGGIATAVFYAVTAGSYSIALWVASYFAESVPGIAAHLLLVPALYAALIKARLIPGRYSE